MVTYVSLINFTDQGIRNIKRSTRSLRGRRTGIGRIEIEDRTCHEHIEPISQNRAGCCRRR